MDRQPAFMVSTHELGRLWGHGGTKSPLGMLAGRCLVPCGLAAGAQGHSGLGVPCPHACCQEAGHCLVPCGPWVTRAWGCPASWCARQFFIGLCCLLFVRVRSCSFSFALVAWIVSRCFAWDFLGLGLSCFGRVGLRFWVSGLFVRSCSRWWPVSIPAASPWLSWVLA